MTGLIWTINMTMRIDLTKPANYIAVQYKGAQFMCVEGSERARWLREANTAWRMGYNDLAFELECNAIKAYGCAFEHREANQ